MKKLNYVLVFVLASFVLKAQIYYKDVAGIFYSRCTQCHNDYSHGASLLNYTQTHAEIGTIHGYLTSNYMPPWTPDTNYTRFVHEHTIPTAEKNAILNWIAGGALKGDTTLAPTAPVYTRYLLSGTPDLELQIPTFTSNATTTADAYNCFALPTGLTQDRIVRAYEIIAGNPSIVHHVIAAVDTTGTEASTTDGSCFNIPGQYSLGGYAPGAEPTVFPNSTILRAGIRIKAGSNIMLQIHYPEGTQGETDSTKIRIYFYPIGTSNVRPVYVSTPLQNWSMSIPANQVKTYTAQYTLPVKLSFFATFPHSHKVCTSIVNYACTTTDTIPLVRINNWDFNWQGYYTYKKMPVVPAGYKLRSVHIFDNTTNNPNNPNDPPQTVIAGTSTSNEMLFDSFQYLYYQAGDENINVDSILASDPLLQTGIKNNYSGNAFHVFAYPNPFSKSVNISYILEQSAKVSIDIYSVLGTHIKTLKNSFETAQEQHIEWDGTNGNGVSLPAGVYFYIIRAGSKQTSGKLYLTSNK